MKPSLLPWLQCPACRGLEPFEMEVEAEEGDEVRAGRLHCPGCGAVFPVVDFIPRFVPSDNYARNFGFQWNLFRTTQLDGSNGTTISQDRFLRQSGWNGLTGAIVLDAGCGAGRFAEIALNLGAEVFAFDYSGAADACWKNLGPHPRLHVFQADIYAIPFREGRFDCVYSFGVLQHTPDPEKALKSLARQLKPGGRLCVDVYLKQWKNLLDVKYWLRSLTTRVPQGRLFSLIERCAPTLLTLSRTIRRLPGGRPFSRLVPIADYEGVHPLSEDQRLQWAILDTFDRLAPRYDRPQTRRTLRRWLEEAGLDRVEVFRRGVLVGRGKRRET